MLKLDLCILFVREIFFFIKKRKKLFLLSTHRNAILFQLYVDMNIETTIRCIDKAYQNYKSVIMSLVSLYSQLFNKNFIKKSSVYIKKIYRTLYI